MATVAKGYDLDYAWRAVGETYRGAGYYLAAAEAGEPPGTWWGPGAERLGFAAGQQVEREPYNLLFGERKGPDGQELGRAPANAGKAVEIYKSLVVAEPGADDHRKAELRIMAQREARQSPLYFDLTTSWSKDISIFHASLGATVQRARDEGDKQAEAVAAMLLAEVDAILRDANNAALAYFQREAGYVRTGSHVTRVDGRESGQFREADLIVASWYQHTSRDGDMQLHTHNQIAHVAITRHDGKGRAPDSTAYYEHARAAGQIASVHAEAALTRRFGLDWVPRPDGMGYGIDGVGADLMDVFSHRRDVINEKVAGELVPRFQAEYGRAPNQRELASLMDKANLRTRKGKDGMIDWDAATRGWQANAAQRAGVDLASLYGRVSRLGRNGSAPRDAGPQLTRDEITRAAQKALEKCSRENSKWTRADLVANLGRVLPRRAADPDGQARLLEEVIDSALAGEFGPVVCLEPPEAAAAPASLRRADGRSPYQRHGGVKYAARVQLSREEKLVAQAGAGGGPAMTREEAARALGAEVADLEAALHQPPGAEIKTAASGLRMDQAAAAFHVLTSDRRVEVIVGPAGAGKTRVLAEIGRAWAQGRVVGVTPSQSSRDVLAEAGLAESYNFAQFLGHLKDRRGARGPVKLSQGDLIVIDEASMFSNPDFADIVDYATRIGAKVAVALDHQQLQAVENGGGASLVTRKQGYVQLPEPVRFSEEWERSASLGLREGRISALADYAEHGRIRAGTAEEILESAAQAYVAHTLEGKDSLVIARSHELRREACRRVRDDLQHLGLVARDGDGPSIDIADAQRATVGDLIVCTDNDHSVDAGEGKTLANMHVLRIESVTPAGPVVRRMLRPGRQTRAPQWTEEAFLFPGYKTAELAYAVTEQVAQGRTVAATRTIVTPGDDRQGTYVGATRGTSDNVIMAITPNPKLADPLPLSRTAPELRRFRDLEERRQGQAAQRSPQGDLDEGMAVLADVLTRDATDLAATEYRERQRSNADHLGLLHAIWMDLTERADAARFRPVVQAALADAWGITDGELDTPTARWLYRTMRAAELAGTDPAEAVMHAVQSRDMDGARDIPAVVDARMRPWVTAIPRPTGRWADRVPEVADSEIREYLGQLATLMDERRERIGQYAAEHQPSWAVKALGPVPEDPGERDRWRERASAVGAYRELFGYDDRQPIGPEPVADHPDKRALWHEAWRALGPAGETDLRDRADGSLWLIRDQYQAETAWAPKHVGRELGYVRASAEDARLRVIRSQAEAELARKDGDAELAARHEQQAERSRSQESAYRMQESILAGLMDDRRAWEAATEPQRRLAVAADTELRRRNPEMRIEPLRSAEPGEVTDEQRAELDVLPEAEQEYQPPPWVRELAEARKAFSEKIAERQSVTEPHEDPDYADIGPAFPSWQQQDRDAVLQPPKPPIPPSERLAEREAEAGERGL